MIYYVKARDRCVSLCCVRCTCVCVYVHISFKNKIFMDLNLVMDMDSVMMNICRYVPCTFIHMLCIGVYGVSK